MGHYTQEDINSLKDFAFRKSTNNKEYELWMGFIGLLTSQSNAVTTSIKLGDIAYDSRNPCIMGIVDKIGINEAYLHISDHLDIPIPLESLVVVREKERIEACANDTATDCETLDANKRDLRPIVTKVEDNLLKDTEKLQTRCELKCTIESFSKIKKWLNENKESLGYMSNCYIKGSIMSFKVYYSRPSIDAIISALEAEIAKLDEE